MYDFLPFAFVLLPFAGLSLWYFYIEKRKNKQRVDRMELEQQERDKARCLYIEEGLLFWLKMLELPQLAEQTKLQEAARQLRIVLVERLMHGPRVR